MAAWALGSWYLGSAVDLVQTGNEHDPTEKTAVGNDSPLRWSTPQEEFGLGVTGTSTNQWVHNCLRSGPFRRSAVSLEVEATSAWIL